LRLRARPQEIHFPEKRVVPLENEEKMLLEQLEILKAEKEALQAQK
jgi:hypothetical protein